VAQDGEHRVWFGTRSGLSVYDGITWKKFDYLIERPGADNIKLRNDENGTMWILARNMEVSISYFKDDKFLEQKRSSYFSPASISSFIVDTINSKRFIFASGLLGEILYCYDTTWKTLNLSTDLNITRLYSAVRMESNIILATDKGLYNFTPEGIISPIQMELPSAPQGLYCEKENQKERLLVGGGTWFGYVENNKFKIITDKLSVTYDPNSPLLEIVPDKRGGYFIGNEFSLNYYSSFDNSVKTIGIVNGLIAGGMTSLLVDFEKNIWVSSFRGVSKISTRTFLNFKNVFLNFENEISSLIEYKPGTMLFGGNYGLSIYNGSEYNYIRLLDSLGEERGHIRVLDLSKDKEGNIWVAAHLKGFFMIDKNFNKKQFSEADKMEGMAMSVQQDKEGNIFLATNKHLYVYDGNTVSFTKDFPVNYNVRKIIKLGNKDLLFCVVGVGVAIKTDNGIKEYTSSDINRRNVFSAYQDEKGKIYLGTVGGLCEINNDSIVKCTLNNNLSIERPIYLILSDNTGNLWFGTDLGVIRYDGEKIFSYTTKDGFAGNEVNRSAGVVDYNNRVWFGTNNGASCYYKEYDSKLDTGMYPAVTIKNIYSQYNNNTAINNREFSYKDNDITFLVFGVSFIDEKENKIRWKLDGFDNQWTAERPFISNEIFYDNINPGTYKLMVQMKNANGIWGPITSSPEFTINKPYYLRWWSMVLGIIVLGFLVYTVQHYFEQRKYNYFLKKEIDRVTTELKETETNYRDTLLKEIHHRVKNNMQIISSLLSLQSSRETDVHLNNVIKESQNRIRSMALIHEKLYQSKKFSELDLSSYVNSLIEYLKRIYLINTSLIKVNLNIDEIFINIDIAIACGLIINELVSNSFKYAFPDNAKGAIFVEIHKQGIDTLFLSIKDNGIGLKNISDLENTDSLGLKLVKMLIKQHQGEYVISNKDGALFEIKLLIVNESVG
jgi:two-component sensor histidine kinase/ligand-binding sensor domain-containing protein